MHFEEETIALYVWLMAVGLPSPPSTSSFYLAASSKESLMAPMRDGWGPATQLNPGGPALVLGSGLVTEGWLADRQIWENSNGFGRGIEMAARRGAKVGSNWVQGNIFGILPGTSIWYLESLSNQVATILAPPGVLESQVTSVRHDCLSGYHSGIY